MTRPTITAELLAWLESKAPYSTAEGDRRHAEIAALVRALEVVRVAADKAVLRGDGTIGHDLPYHRMEYTSEWNYLREALAACEKAMTAIVGEKS